MPIMVGENYRLTSSTDNIVVEQRTNKGKWRPVGYFGKLKEALKFLVDFEVRKTELVDLEAVVAKQEELYGMIEGLNIAGG